MKKDREDILQGTSVGMEKLHKKSVGYAINYTHSWCSLGALWWQWYQWRGLDRDVLRLWISTETSIPPHLAAAVWSWALLRIGTASNSRAIRRQEGLGLQTSAGVESREDNVGGTVGRHSESQKRQYQTLFV